MEFSNSRLLKSKNMCSDVRSKLDDLIVTAAILDESKIKKTKGPFPSRALEANFKMLVFLTVLVFPPNLHLSKELPPLHTLAKAIALYK